MEITIEELSNILEAQVKRISQGRLDLGSLSIVVEKKFDVLGLFCTTSDTFLIIKNE